MKETGIPTNEEQRIAALHSYGIMDTPPEKEYDDITKLAADICATPFALITLVDDKKQWFKSRHGIDLTESARVQSFCEQALEDPSATIVIKDLREDKRYEKNSFVTGEPHVAFYAGVPLVTPSGYSLGTLCVLDRKPKELNPQQLSSLEALARQVMTLFELHRKNRELQILKEQLENKNKELEQFAYVVSHDIKTPVSNIVLSSQLLREDYSDQLDKNANNLLDILKRASAKIKDLVDGILSYYKSDAALLHKQEEIELSGFFKAIVDILAFNKEAVITYPNETQYIHTGRTVLEQIFLNLLNNAIKYNDKEIAEISISFSETSNFYRFVVADNGRGIREKDYEKIFSLFTNLGDKDRFGNTGTGIGLSIVKKLVENHGGTITIDSEHGRGSTFQFTLKKRFN
jgi:signal transduction histidine kinase